MAKQRKCLSVLLKFSSLRSIVYCSFAVFICILLFSESVVAIVGRGKVSIAQQPATTQRNPLLQQQANERPLQLLNQAIQLLEQGTAESRQEALEKTKQALNIWQELGERLGEAQAFSVIGLVYLSSGENQKAVTYFEKTLIIWRENKKILEEATTLITTAHAYSELENQETALNYLQQALSIYKAEKLLTEEARTLESMGTIYMKFSQPKQALKSFYQALEIYRAHNNLSSQASILSFIALAYDLNGEAEKARDAEKQAQDIRKRVNSVQQPAKTEQQSPLQQAQEQAWQLLDEAQQLLLEGTVDSRQLALEKAKQALKIWQDLGVKQGQASALSFIGLVYSSSGENKKAVTYFEQALTILRDRKDKLGEATTLLLAAGEYSASGNQQSAINYLQQALSIFQIKKLPGQQAQTLLNISNVYIKFGQTKQAIQSLYKALEIYSAQKDWQKQASILSLIGAAYNSNGETTKALDFYKQSLDIYRQNNDFIGESEILRNMGMFYFSLGEPQKALSSLKQSLKLRQAAQEQLSTQPGFANLLDESLILILIGQAHAYLGNYQLAFDYNDQALALVRKVGNPSFVAIVLSASSSIYNVTNDYYKQRETLKEALNLQREIGDRPGQISTLNDIAGIYVAFGSYQKALNFYNQALVLVRELENPSLEADTYRKIAEVYSFLGDNDLSTGTLTQALNIYQELGNKLSQTQALIDIGETWRKSKDYPKAIEFFKQGLQLSKEQQNSMTQLTLLSKMIMTYESMQDYPRGLEASKEALSISRQIEIGVGEAVILNLMGKIYMGLGDYDTALKHMHQSVFIANKLKNKQVEANTLKNIGQVHNRLGNLREAINTFNRETELRQVIGDRTNEVEAQYNIALNERNLGNLDAARTRIEKAIAIIEGIRSNVERRELRSSYFSTVQKYYEFYINLLMELHNKYPLKGYAAKALHASESVRTRNLIELLIQARVDIRQGVNKKLLERERFLQQEISATEFRRLQLLKSQYTNKQLEEIKRKIKSLVSELDEVESQILVQSPEYASLTQGNQLNKLTLKLPEIQKQVLDENTLLLQYSLGEERTYLWLVSNKSIKTYELPKRESIETAVKQFNIELGKKELEDIDPEVGIKLSQMILSPVAKELGQKRLLIVANGILQTVPFATLPIPNVDKQRKASTTPLLLNHEIVTLPSASSIGVLRSKIKGRRVAPKTIAVLADPVFKDDDERLTKIRQTRATGKQGTRDAERACINLGRLQYTEKEAKDILALVPKHQSLKAVEFDASRSTATSPELAKYKIVHFATHGCINEDYPQLSGVALSQFDKKGQEIKDGMLFLQDIYNLNLPVELVTLSACKTGLGKDVKGEGLIGLTRGFMYAGAKRVVVSLWSVNDVKTADLMEKFYRQMLTKQKRLIPVSALRKAQLEMWKQGYAPYYWGAFVVQGEWR